MSDHRWNYQEDDEHTGFTGNLAVLGVGGHEERRRRGGGGGKRKKGDGKREEEDWKEIRMADGQQDTTHRGSTSLVHPRTPFFWVAAAKFLTQRFVGSSQAMNAKIIRRRSIRFSTRALSIGKYTWSAYATPSYPRTNAS